jgi:acyl dehydratase
VEVEVLDVRRSKNRPGYGYVKSRTTTINQNGEPVQEIVVSVLVQARTE